MQTIIKSALAVLAVSVMFVSCKQYESPREESAAEESAAVSSASDKIETATDTVKKLTDKRKLIRTADLKFKVKNVAKSTTLIENTANKFGGLVTKSDLQSTVFERNETQFSRDSTLVTTKYSVENNMTIRVPNAQLDTVVKAIAAEIDFLDVRVIKADDVSLQLLSNQLVQNRNSEQHQRLANAIDAKGKKLNQIVTAEDALAGKNENYDNAKLNNLALKDQIAYSTVTLKIYQPEMMRKELVASLVTPRPNIGLQLFNSLQTGWYILEGILAFVVQLWSLIGIALLAFVVYKKTLRKTKPAL